MGSFTAISSFDLDREVQIEHPRLWGLARGAEGDQGRRAQPGILGHPPQLTGLACGPQGPARSSLS